MLQEDINLHFEIFDPNGPAKLDLYMGMISHAAIQNEDGKIFAHLHPTGTISMAAQMALQRDFHDLKSCEYVNDGKTLLKQTLLRFHLLFRIQDIIGRGYK